MIHDLLPCEDSEEAKKVHTFEYSSTSVKVSCRTRPQVSIVEQSSNCPLSRFVSPKSSVRSVRCDHNDLKEVLLPADPKIPCSGERNSCFPERKLLVISLKITK